MMMMTKETETTTCQFYKVIIYDFTIYSGDPAKALRRGSSYIGLSGVKWPSLPEATVRIGWRRVRCESSQLRSGRSRARGRPTDGHPLREARERPAGGAGLRGVVSPHCGRDRAAGHGSVEDRGRAVQVHRVRPRPGARPRAGEAAAPRVPRPAGGEEASGFGSAAKAEAVRRAL